MKRVIALLTVLFCLNAQGKIYQAIDISTGQTVLTNVAPNPHRYSEIKTLDGIRPSEPIVPMPAVQVETADTQGAMSVADAFKNHRSNVLVTGVGTVMKLLAQDNIDIKHQRFILKMNSGQTVLVAHNIDIAPTIDNLSIDDQVAFLGEYVWGEKGGTVHWTHRDLKGKHVAGWLKHRGSVYQ